jgi:hypothetical protein
MGESIAWALGSLSCRRKSIAIHSWLGIGRRIARSADVDKRHVKQLHRGNRPMD